MTAEVLYLVNLMLAPGVAFVVLLMLYLINRRQAPPLAVNHLAQTTGVSLVGGTLIAAIIGLVLLLGELDSGYIWVIVILYFTLVHTSLILMGVIGLVKALNGEHFSYPIIGRMFNA